MTSWWGIDKSIDELQHRLAGMEEAIRTTSMLRTQGLVQILSAYGFPFLISGTITGWLTPWLESLAATRGGASLLKMAVYLVLAVILLTGVRGLQHLWVRSGKPLSKAPAPRPAPDPSEQDD